METEGLLVEKLNNQDFVLINTYECHNERIYYFRTMREELFCTKEGDTYKPIEDSYLLWLYRNLFGSLKLFKNKIFYNQTLGRRKLSSIAKPITKVASYVLGISKLEPEQEEKLKQEQKENFKELRERFGITVSEDKTNQVLDSLKMFGASQNFPSAGLYQPIVHGIFINSAMLKNWDDLESKKARFHECIHAHTGRGMAMLEALFLRGFLEGQTENLTSEFFGEKYSSLVTSGRGRDRKQIEYNFPTTTGYKDCVCITKQMEAAIGQKSHDSIVNGNLSFEREFAKKYGILALTYLAGKTELMALETNFNLGLNKEYLIRSTQNTLLKTVFNRDFKDIKSVEDAREYFEKLREFEKTRARTSSLDPKTGRKTEEDTTYEKYYEKQLQKAKEKLKSLGIPEEQIQDGLKEYQYQRQDFKDKMNPILRGKIDFAEIIVKTTEANQPPNLKDYRLIKVKDPNGVITYTTVKNNVGYEMVTAIDVLNNRAKRITFRTDDFQKRWEELEQMGSEVEDITDSLSIEEIMESIMDEKARLKLVEEKNNKKQENSLIPSKKANIFKRLFNRIKEAFQKKPIALSPQAHNNGENKKQENKPSWDMRNYSEEDQKKAKNIENPEFINSAVGQSKTASKEDTRGEK